MRRVQAPIRACFEPHQASNRANKKCTEAAPSSDFPTDHRRSDNHSESHQPQTLRSRCIGDTRDRTAIGQAPPRPNSAQFAEMGVPPLTPPGALCVDPVGRCDRRRTACPDPVEDVTSSAVTSSSAAGAVRAASASLLRSTKMHRAVTSSSGFPTDCRRSGRRSESHRPRTLRTRCIAHTRDVRAGRQADPRQDARDLRCSLRTGSNCGLPTPLV